MQRTPPWPCGGWLCYTVLRACACELAFLGVSIRRDWKDRCCFGYERASNGMKQQTFKLSVSQLSAVHLKETWGWKEITGYRVDVCLVCLFVCEREATGGRQRGCVALSVDGGHEARQLRWCHGGSARLTSNVRRVSYIRPERTGAPHQSAFTIRKGPVLN